jgi:hypothetical protein
VPSYTYLSKTFDFRALLQQEAANKSDGVSRVDVGVVDPMMFKDHSRNCYVNDSEEQR